MKERNKHDEEKDEMLVQCCSQTVYKLEKNFGYWPRQMLIHIGKSLCSLFISMDTFRNLPHLVISLLSKIFVPYSIYAKSLVFYYLVYRNSWNPWINWQKNCWKWWSTCSLCGVVLKNTPLMSLLISKGKAVPLQAWSGPEGSRKLRLPDFMTTAQDGDKVVSLTHRPSLPPGNYPDTHFCYRLSRPQGHNAIGRILWQ